MKHTLGRSWMVVIATLLVAVAAGCGGDSESESTPEAAGEEQAASKETLVMAADPSLLPYNFFEEGSEDWTGINVDIATALEEEMGVDIEIQSVPFDSIIPGLKAGRYDFALTGMFDTKERQATIDFVDYVKAKNNFLLRSDDPQDIQSLEDLCGTHVGLAKGAFEIQVVEEQSKTCEKNGDKPVDLDVFSDLNAVTLGLTGGRIDVVPNDSATNAYLIDENEGDLKATGEYLAEGYFAAGIPKDSPLLEQMQQAMQAMHDNGKLEQILGDWGIADRIPDEITINNAAF